MTRRVTDWELEQLVDGELDESAYRQILATLSDEPDGWRRCALAFLEHQALARDLIVERSVPLPACSQPHVTAPPASFSTQRFASMVLMIAASFLLAFLAGHEYQKWRGRTPTDTQLARDATHPASTNVGANPPIPRVGDDSILQGYGSEPSGRVQLVMDGPDGAGQSIEIPVYSWDPVTSQLLVNDQSSIPPQVYEALQNLGREVRRSQYFAPVQLNDGRKAVIPVEQLEITPVSQSY